MFDTFSAVCLHKDGTEWIISKLDNFPCTWKKINDCSVQKRSFKLRLRILKSKNCEASTCTSKRKFMKSQISGKVLAAKRKWSHDQVDSNFNKVKVLTNFTLIIRSFWLRVALVSPLQPLLSSPLWLELVCWQCSDTPATGQTPSQVSFCPCLLSMHSDCTWTGTSSETGWCWRVLSVVLRKIKFTVGTSWKALHSAGDVWWKAKPNLNTWATQILVRILTNYWQLQLQIIFSLKAARLLTRDDGQQDSADDFSRGENFPVHVSIRLEPCQSNHWKYFCVLDEHLPLKEEKNWIHYQGRKPSASDSRCPFLGFAAAGSTDQNINLVLQTTELYLQPCTVGSLPRNISTKQILDPLGRTNLDRTKFDSFVKRLKQSSAHLNQSGDRHLMLFKYHNLKIKESCCVHNKISEIVISQVLLQPEVSRCVGLNVVSVRTCSYQDAPTCEYLHQKLWSPILKLLSWLGAAWRPSEIS